MFPEKTDAQPGLLEVPDLPWRSEPQGIPAPHGVPDPLYRNRTPRQGKESTPRLGEVRSHHVSAITDAYIRPLGLHIKAHQPLHSLRQEDVRIDVTEAEAIP